ncbi:MAG TPA: LysR substrate-binding domain-containing protein [Roseiarcus sp.]|jgi:LysR family glycine cleavage system transcriptional activator
MRRLPPLGALRAFEAAARRLSFKDAAEELGLTPTAISHHVRLLEDHCGAKLFRRRPRPLALTAAGEKLLPGLRYGFDTFAAALSSIGRTENDSPLRITSTNAFASRWLVPRLGGWRANHPDIPLSVIGTDRIVEPDEADLAIRYARSPPLHAGRELFRDCHYPVCSPSFVAGREPIASPADLGRYPLIQYDWFANDRLSPNWKRWFDAACGAPEPWVIAFSFREEAHAIEAALAGQGVTLCSDVVVADELASGALVKAFDFGLPGYAFYPVFAPHHPRRETLEAFVLWLREMAASA